MVPTDKLSYSTTCITFIEDTTAESYIALNSFKEQQKEAVICKQLTEDITKLEDIRSIQKEQYEDFLIKLNNKQRLDTQLQQIDETLHNAGQLITKEIGTMLMVAAF